MAGCAAVRRPAHPPHGEPCAFCSIDSIYFGALLSTTPGALRLKFVAVGPVKTPSRRASRTPPIPVRAMHGLTHKPLLTYMPTCSSLQTHHPLSTAILNEVNTSQRWSDLRSVVEAHPNVRLVLTGHFHKVGPTHWWHCGGIVAAMHFKHAL